MYSQMEVVLTHCMLALLQCNTPHPDYVASPVFASSPTRC